MLRDVGSVRAVRVDRHVDEADRTPHRGEDVQVVAWRDLHLDASEPRRDELRRGRVPFRGLRDPDRCARGHRIALDADESRRTSVPKRAGSAPSSAISTAAFAIGWPVIGSRREKKVAADGASGPPDKELGHEHRSESPLGPVGVLSGVDRLGEGVALNRTPRGSVGGRARMSI